KRLVFSFDGTWNRLDSLCPTNVVLTAESVLPLASDGIAQINYYHQGVGTGKWDRLSGGMFGAGLTTNLADAYLHLIFNYTPGDDIFVFGFSRGAFTARSFVGLLRNCGIVARCHASGVGKAIELYRSRRSDDAPWGARAEKFRADYVPDPLPAVAYLGVWDTVGALGVPNLYGIARLFNRRFAFHDTALSPCVRSARHAVAIDEDRHAFEPALWENFEELNLKAGKDPAAPEAPYQQKWFPGVHRAVGGGAKARGLSDQSLEWIWAGARLAGLELDSSPSSRIYSLQPDYTEPLDAAPRSTPTALGRLKAAIAGRMWKRSTRPGAPSNINHVSVAARRRWHTASELLAERRPYRPALLAQVAQALEADTEYRNPAPIPAQGTFDVVVVKAGDTLGRIARDRIGDARKWPEIFEMNRDKLADPNRIYCGMTLRVRKRPEPAEADAIPGTNLSSRP
ncbi:phospholipase effector Tle1 domain-containing protein, partial [Allosphingosinicella sp.]|uniref:DUF2235 domain-containing protein n=1 Tax=Allosphingosinicella sp. TaxID=2823234 RepID=UPI002EF0B612